MMVRRITAVGLILSLFVLLAACGTQQAERPEAVAPASTDTAGTRKLEGRLTLYTSIQPTELKKLEPLMQTALPGVELEIFQAGTEKLIAKLAAEMEAGKVGADVVMVADPAYYLTLKKQGMLLAHKPAGAQKVLGEADPEGYFTSVRVINTVIGYNTRLVKPADAPRRFADLTDPKWQNATAMVDPRLSGSAFDTVAALSEKYGWTYFQQLKGNGMQVVDGHGTLQSKLAAGEFKAVILLEMNLLSAIKKGDPVQLVYPEDGVVMLPSPIGIMKTTKNPDAARALVDWWFGPEGQGALAAANHHPVLPGYPSPEGARPISEIQRSAIAIDWRKLSDNYDRIKDEFTKVMN